MLPLRRVRLVGMSIGVEAKQM